MFFCEFEDMGEGPHGTRTHTGSAFLKYLTELLGGQKLSVDKPALSLDDEDSACSTCLSWHSGGKLSK